MRLLVRLLRLGMHLLPCLGHRCQRLGLQSPEAAIEVSTVQCCYMQHNYLLQLPFAGHQCLRQVRPFQVRRGLEAVDASQ